MQEAITFLKGKKMQHTNHSFLLENSFGTSFVAQVLSLNYRALPEDAALCSCGVEEPKIGNLKVKLPI